MDKICEQEPPLPNVGYKQSLANVSPVLLVCNQHKRLGGHIMMIDTPLLMIAVDPATRLHETTVLNSVYVAYHHHDRKQSIRHRYHKL